MHMVSPGAIPHDFCKGRKELQLLGICRAHIHNSILMLDINILGIYAQMGSCLDISPLGDLHECMRN